MVKRTDLEILADLHVASPSDTKKRFLICRLSVHLVVIVLLAST
jgi:hypothetical protein